MSEERKGTADDQTFWTELKVNFRGVGESFQKIWVIKLGNGQYIRCITTGGFVGVSRRMATRFDSLAWLETLKSAINPEAKPRAVRLVTKAEKALGKVNRSWRHVGTTPEGHEAFAAERQVYAETTADNASDEPSDTSSTGESK